MAELFAMMIERRASHLHLVPGSPMMMRMEGILTPVDGPLISPADTAALLESFLNEEQRYYFFENKDLNISQSVPGLSRFRINVFQQRGSVAFVIGTHPPTPPTMDELGVPDSLKKIVQNARQGLILVCGGRNSGKSATMASFVRNLLEMRMVQIVSMENPIDYLHKNSKGIICQREIGTDVLSFEAAIESLTYQQPDVVMATEFESFELISTFLNMAVGGSLCLAIMKAPNIYIALDNILNVYPPHQAQLARNLLASALEVAVAQTLVNRASAPGLVPAFEVLTCTIPPVRQALREGKLANLSGLMASAGREYGMQTQEQALRGLVRKNLVTAEDAAAKASRPDEFKKAMALPF